MNKKKEIIFFKTTQGKVPVLEWLEEFDYRTQDRINARLERIAISGHYGDYKNLGDGIKELRFFFGSGYRIYFGEHNERMVILLTGGDKSSQSSDIEKAKQYWKEYIAKNYN